jgi:photosystem II stability/assembly factor-like uncharacterized protein
MRYALILCVLFAATTANAQWEIQTAPTTADLRGIDNVGKGIAWASGSDGTVLRTADDGKDWQLCPTPPSAEHLDFRGIQAFDEKTAIIMSTGKGPLSRFYKTTDACQSWKLLFTNPDPEGSWDALVFRFDPVLNPTSGYHSGILLGDPVNGRFIIYDTKDGGETWTRWDNPAQMGANSPVSIAKPLKGETLFAASNSAAMTPGVNGPFAFVTGGEAGSRALLLQPHSLFDNGTTWKFSISRLPWSAGATSGAFSVASRPTGRVGADLMVVGGDYEKPDVPATTAYLPFSVGCCFGLIQQKVIKSDTPPHGFRSAVAYDAASHSWITVGPNGTDISTDDGRNWRALRPDPALDEPADADRNWNALSLPFVVGPHGRIGKLRPDALKSATP